MLAAVCLRPQPPLLPVRGPETFVAPCWSVASSSTVVLIHSVESPRVRFNKFSCAAASCASASVNSYTYAALTESGAPT